METLKIMAKQAANFAALLLVSPLLLLYWTGTIILNKDSLFVGFSQALSLIPGKIGGYLRKGFLNHTLAYCHNDCVIAFGTLFSQIDTEIEQGVYIGPQCNIGKSRIEKNCLLGSGVHILSGKKQHSFDDVNTPIQNQGGTFEKIVIGEDSWIGNGAIVMANVGKNCIIGAGSVVMQDIEDFSIVVGNPARLVKKRKTND